MEDGEEEERREDVKYNEPSDDEWETFQMTAKNTPFFSIPRL